MAQKAGRYIAWVWDPDVPAASIREGSPSGPEICTVKAQDHDGIKKLVGMLNDRADLLEALKKARVAIATWSPDPTEPLEEIDAVIANAEAESAGEKKCICGAMSEQDCDDLPSLRHCGGAEVTSAPTPAPVSEEREELAKAIEKTADNLDSLSFDFDGDSSQLDAITEAADHLRNYATTLRTPHGLQGEAIPQTHIITLRNHTDKLAEQYGKNAGIVLALRIILSHMTASREDM